MDPVVFVPGLLCDQRLFAPQLAMLASRTATAIGDTLSDDTIAGMAARTLAAAPPRFALCGLSMGGFVALEIMRQAPERVTRLALLDTQARGDTPESTERRHDLMALARRGELKGVSARLLPLFIHPDRLSDSGLCALIASMAEGVGVEAFLRQQNALIHRADHRPNLPAISCPTLVLCGRQDQLTPLALHEEMAAAIPGATLVVLPHCGHLAPLELPQAVNAQLLHWLED